MIATTVLFGSCKEGSNSTTYPATDTTVLIKPDTSANSYTSNKSKKKKKKRNKSTGNPITSSNNSYSSSSSNSYTSATKRKTQRMSNARQYITGPRGGCYYINSNGNKTYVDRSYCN